MGAYKLRQSRGSRPNTVRTSTIFVSARVMIGRGDAHRDLQVCSLSRFLSHEKGKCFVGCHTTCINSKGDDQKVRRCRVCPSKERKVVHACYSWQESNLGMLCTPSHYAFWQETLEC